MKIEINNLALYGHGGFSIDDRIGRHYETRFLSKRLNPEEGVEINEFRGHWKFLDTKLGFPLRCEISETILSGNPMTKVSVHAIFDRTEDDRARTEQVDRYVCSQLEQVARDGMVKL